MELSQLVALADRVKSAIPENLNEANTKTSLVLPFIQSMGYDVFDHNEVAQEYTSEWGTKKGEKVDIAILRDGQPVVLIECKPLGDPLDTGKCSQLFRYFSTQPARIGILTNGQRYLFFSDLEKQNVMDGKPFMEIDLLNFNERVLPELQKLTKDTWDLDGALSSAETLKFTRAVKLLVAQDFEEPTDDIVRHYAASCYEGKLVTRVIEMFRPIVKRAFAEHVSDQIAKRLESVRIAAEVPQLQAKVQTEGEGESVTLDTDCVADSIVTCNTEEWAHIIVRTLLRGVIDPSRVIMRDQKSYCSVILDNNNRKPICRFFNFEHFEPGMENIGKNAYIQRLTKSNSEGERFDLKLVDDIHPLGEKLVEAVMRHEKVVLE